MEMFLWDRHGEADSVGMYQMWEGKGIGGIITYENGRLDLLWYI